MKLFVGMIIAMGLHQVPQLEHYWTSDSLLAVPGIVKGCLLTGSRSYYNASM